MGTERQTDSASLDENAIQQVVSEYYDAFVRDAAVAATYYGEPTLVVLPTGVVSLPTRREVEGFLAEGMSRLKALGYASTTMSRSRVKRLSDTTALYGTVAIRKKTDGRELERVGFTYLLYKGGAGWKIHELVTTDVDKLIG